MYNRLSFDRSWIVVSDVPHRFNLELAKENGIGVILVTRNATVLVRPVRQKNPPTVRIRLRNALRQREVC